MKIIKLNNSTETTGRFTNIFDDSITLSENAEIALLNCSINVKTKNIIVTSTNKTFKVKLSSLLGEPTLTVTLDEGVFSWDSFRDNLNKAMNKALVWSGDAAYQYSKGFQWKISKSVNDEVAISFDRVNTNGDGMNSLVRMVNVTYDSTSQSYSKNGGIDGRFDAYVQTNRYFTGGCGKLSFTIELPPSSDPTFIENGFIIGLIDAEKTLDPSEDRDIDAFDYALYIDRNTLGTDLNTYYKRYNPETDTFDIIATGNPPRNNWVFNIYLTQGTIKFTVYNSASVVPVFNESFEWTTNNYKKHYYCAMSFKFLDTSGISKVKEVVYYPDPFHTIATPDSPENYNYQGEKNYNGVENNSEILGAIPRTNVIITFEDEGIKQLLGFTNDTYDSGPIVRHTFKSEKKIEEILLPDNVKIELDDIDLEAYDSYTKGHRNIIACIPNITYKPDSSQIIYQTNYPIFMNLRNMQRKILNTFRVSILNYENDPIKLEENETDITLLVK